MIESPNPALQFLPWASGAFKKPLEPLEGPMRFHRRFAILIKHSATCEALECVWWGHLPQARCPKESHSVKAQQSLQRLPAITKARALDEGSRGHSKLKARHRSVEKACTDDQDLHHRHW